MTMIARNMIRQYELGEPINPGSLFTDKIPSNRMPARPFHPAPIRISNSNGEIIYNQALDNALQHRITSFSVQGEAGEEYRVETASLPPPYFVRSVFGRLGSLQFILIFLASTCVSLLLSWSITRPLKKLGSYSRHYADGDTGCEIDSSLSNRGDELGDLARDFQFMTSEIEKNIQTQKQLLHDVSHELRAPLARLQAAVAVAQQNDASTTIYSDRIHVECQNMGALIQRILDLSRIEHRPEEIRKLNLRAITKEQIENLRFEYPSRCINFAIEDSKIIINSYKGLIEQALENILRNACKHTPASSPIDAFVEKTEHCVNLVVRDYGEGVAENELERLLTPFYRAGNKKHTEGFGLGLSIAQRAMEKINGKIDLQNHPESGLVVTLEIPLN